MNNLKDERKEFLNEKAAIANEDFELLLNKDSVAFYESCEVTQIFLVVSRVFRKK